MARVVATVTVYFARLTNVELGSVGWYTVRVRAAAGGRGRGRGRGRARAKASCTPVSVVHARQSLPIRQACDLALSLRALGLLEGSGARLDLNFELLFLPFRSPEESSAADSDASVSSRRSKQQQQSLTPPDPSSMRSIASKSFRLPYALRGSSPFIDVRFTGVSSSLSVCMHSACTSVRSLAPSISRRLSFPALACTSSSSSSSKLSARAAQEQDDLLECIEPSYAWLCYRLGDSYTQHLKERFSANFDGMSAIECGKRIEDNLAHASDMLQSKWKRLLGKSGKGREFMNRTSDACGIHPLASDWVQSVSAPLTRLDERALNNSELEQLRETMLNKASQEQAVNLDWLAGATDAPILGVVDFVPSGGSAAAQSHRTQRQEITPTEVHVQQALANPRMSHGEEGMHADLHSEDPSSSSAPVSGPSSMDNSSPPLQASPYQSRGTHLFVLVHGIYASAEDMRFIRGQLWLALSTEPIDVLISRANEGNNGKSVLAMGERLADEIAEHIRDCHNGVVERLSFIAHSMGALISRAALLHQPMEQYFKRLQSLISISGAHLGVSNHMGSWILSNGLSVLRTILGLQSLQELTLRDGNNRSNRSEQTLMHLAKKANFGLFKQVVLVSSPKDSYVSEWSARAEMPEESLSGEESKQLSEMSEALVQPLCERVRNGTARFVKVEIDPSERASVVSGRKTHVSLLERTAWLESLLYTHADLFV